MHCISGSYVSVYKSEPQQHIDLSILATTRRLPSSTTTQIKLNQVMSASNLSTKAEHAVAAGASIGQGQVGDWGHPLHPATVHFPIGLLALSFTLDSLQLAPSLMSKLSSYSLLPPPSLIRPLAHYAGAAGVLAAIPTIATGVAELYQMWRNQVKDTRTVGTIAKDVKNSAQSDAIAGQKLRTTLTHASLNDVVVGIAAYNW
jgi:hypothetical protein